MPVFKQPNSSRLSPLKIKAIEKEQNLLSFDQRRERSSINDGTPSKPFTTQGQRSPVKFQTSKNLNRTVGNFAMSTLSSKETLDEKGPKGRN